MITTMINQTIIFSTIISILNHPYVPPAESLYTCIYLCNCICDEKYNNINKNKIL